MAGNNSIRGDETVTFTDNMSFDGTERGGKMTTDGELWIGSTAAPHVRKGSLSSVDNSVTITTGNGTIDLSTAATTNSGITVIISQQVDMLSTGTTSLFTFANEFNILACSFYGTDVTGSVSVDGVYNVGWTAPNYDDLVLAGNTYATDQSYLSPNILNVTTTEYPVIPAGSQLHINVTNAETGATTCTQRVDLWGYYNVSGGGGSLVDLHDSRFIVSSDLNDGANYTTIQAAITAAVGVGGNQTVFIQPGTYTEDLTLSPNVNLCAHICDADTPNVTIIGNSTLSSAGTVTISGVRLTTDSAPIITCSGSVASVINLENCYLNCLNNTGISFTSSSASASIKLYSCNGNIGTTGITLFTHSSAGVLEINRCNIDNSGNSTTASTVSSGGFEGLYTRLKNPVTISGTGAIGLRYCAIETNATNTTALTAGGSGTQGTQMCFFASGSASAVSVSTGLTINLSEISSTNTNAITGAGTLFFSNLSFSGSSSVINTTTQTPLYTNLGKSKATGQPAFLAIQYSIATNVTGDGTAYTLGSTVDLTEVFDQNNNFDPTTGTFTAPATGKYKLEMCVFVTGGTAITEIELRIVTSNKTYRRRNNLSAASAQTSGSYQLSVLADMDASDTATFSLYTIDTAGLVDDVFGEAANGWTFVCGNLVC